jgi:rRNA biogenesis protein RRP5
MERHRISFGLKPSYFVDGAVGESEETQGDIDGPESEVLGVVEEHDEMLDAEQLEDNSTIEEVVGDDSEDEAYNDVQFDLGPASHVLQQRTVGPSSAAILKLQGGFHWLGNEPRSEDDVESGSSSDESLGTYRDSKKKKRRRKEIEQDSTAIMLNKTPESNADFERLLLGSPDSSYLWVQYMSFQLQLSEVEKGREIGRRALQTINFREEQEKLNVWIALLNLENVYGTDETLDTTFKDAACHNDSKTIHLRLASIFDQTEKHEVIDLEDLRSLTYPNIHRKLKRSINERARNLAKARKFGHPLGSIIFAWEI